MSSISLHIERRRLIGTRFDFLFHSTLAPTATATAATAALPATATAAEKKQNHAEFPPYVHDSTIVWIIFTE